MVHIINNTFNFIAFEKDFPGFFEIHNYRNEFININQDKGIYIFVYENNINRLIGSSAILKIGETINLRKRMIRYFNESNIDKLKDLTNRQTAYRLRDFFDNSADFHIKLYFKSFPDSEKKELRDKELNLLLKYIEKHKEVPPLNMGLH